MGRSAGVEVVLGVLVGLAVWDVCLFGYLYGLLEKIGLGK